MQEDQRPGLQRALEIVRAQADGSLDEKCAAALNVAAKRIETALNGHDLRQRIRAQRIPGETYRFDDAPVSGYYAAPDERGFPEHVAEAAARVLGDMHEAADEGMASHASAGTAADACYPEPKQFRVSLEGRPPWKDVIVRADRVLMGRDTVRFVGDGAVVATYMRDSVSVKVEDE